MSKMLPSLRTLTVTTVASLAFVLTVAAVTLVPVNGGDLSSSETPGSAILAVSFVAMGALLSIRRPANAIGWIFLVAGSFNAVNAFTVEFPRFAADEGWPGAQVAAWAAMWAWAGGAAGFPLILLLFPTGRSPTPRWRWVTWLAGAAAAFSILPMTIGAWPVRAELVRDLDLSIVGGVAASMQQLGTLGLGLALVASVVSMIVRFARSRSVERQQLKWLVFAGFLTLTIMVTVSPAAPLDLEIPGALLNVVALLALPSIPVAAAIAILRYRLYDIDVVINRTLVYGALTAILAVAYFGFVVVFQRAVPGASDSDLAVAASTLAVAALFRPARARIQAFIDRRFYRARYDARRTLEDFGSRLRDEVDLAFLRDDVLGVVRGTVAPRHASLWLRNEGRA